MMYQGKHSTSGSPRAERPAASRRAGSRKKPMTLLVALILVLALAAGGSVAWLVATTGNVENSMEPGKVPVDIEEKINGTVKESIVIKNLGNIDAYVRVAVVANRVDEDGNIVAGAAPVLNLNADKWQQLSDGYYYYKGVVAPGKATESLGSISFDDAEVNILAESIQVLGGISGDGNASIDAWHAKYENGSWAKTA